MMREDLLYIVFRILSLANESWFANGEDCPEDTREEIKIYQEDIELADIQEPEWYNILNDALMCVIYKDKRSIAIENLISALPPLFRITGVSPLRMLEILKEKGIVQKHLTDND